MPFTSKMSFQYPSEHQEPYNDIFTGLMNSIDSSVYALREDAHITLLGGGTLALTLATNTFSWSADLIVVSSLNGASRTITTDSLVVTEGQSVYAVISRPITGTGTLTLQAASGVGTDHDKLFLGVRVNDDLYLKDGTKITGT